MSKLLLLVIGVLLAFSPAFFYFAGVNLVDVIQTLFEIRDRFLASATVFLWTGIPGLLFMWEGMQK